MEKVSKSEGKGKKKKVMGKVKVMGAEEYEGMALDARVELIQQLIPLGLMHVAEELQKEVRSLAGERYERGSAGAKENVRSGAEHSG